MIQLNPKSSYNSALNMILLKLLFLIIINLTITSADHGSSPPSICSKSCGSSRSPDHLPYPFGFSAGCPIRLNCSSTGQPLVGQFPVRSVSADTVKLSVESKCNRSASSVGRLFGRNYAPTWRNAILFENCSRPAPCTIPATPVRTNFESGCGSNNSTMRCYSENKTDGFLDRVNVTRSGCRYLSSTILADFSNSSSVSLDVKVVELGWWLEGDCQCSVDANCSKIVSPVTGEQGFRCRCREGLVGDGYLAGVGCLKASSDCGPSKYISGKCGGTSRIGTLVGGILGCACVMISLGLLCYVIKKRAFSKSHNKKKNLLHQSTGITIPIYPYKEIERATNGFSDKQRLGTGAYGTVYSAQLRNKEWVAIKRLKPRDTGEQIKNEIKLISSLSHPHIVHLLGCCVDNGEQILVYEFMPNGTLCQHLQGQRGTGLPWPARLNIAVETAHAIAYLHSTDPPIYHRDVKSSNILLDYNLASKVADFGLSRLGMTELSVTHSHISTAPQGTPGYLDPQYHQNFHLSDKSDVYSFGVVLVEIITSMKAVDFTRHQNEINLANLATDRIGKGKLDEIIDPSLEPDGDAWTLSSIHKVAELAFRCLAFHRDVRPSMAEVAAELESVRVSRSAAPASLGAEKGALLSLEIGTSSMTSTEMMMTVDSPVSMQDSWLSEASSPSSNSLLSNVVR